MADLKISQLTGATTPLAGTEVVPLVQSSTTKKVSVANLTIGRAVELGKNSFTRSDGGTTSDTSNGFRITPSSAAITDSFYRLETGSGVLIGAYGNVGDELSIWTRDTSDAVRIAQNGTVTLKNNVVPAAAKGVNFTANTPAAGMTSQLLNDYQEGTWTPADDSGAGLTITNNGTATFVKVGKQVTCTMDITYPVTANGNTAQITFPFATASGPSSVGQVGYQTYGAAVFPSGGGTGFNFWTAAGAALTNANLSGKRLQISFTYRSAS